MANRGEWNIKLQSGKCIDMEITSNDMGVKSMIKSLRDSTSMLLGKIIMFLASEYATVHFDPKFHCGDAIGPEGYYVCSGFALRLRDMKFGEPAIYSK